MAFTPVETIAFIFILGGILKLLIIAIDSRTYFNFAKKLWKVKGLTWIFLVLAFVVFYYVVQEVNIIQILAVTAFVSMLFATQFARYSKETLSIAQKMTRNPKSMWATNWLYILLWVILLALGLIALFS